MMAYNESETRFYLIDPVLRAKGYGDQRWLKLERPASVEPTGPKGRRRRGPGRTDYLLCVQLDAMPAPLPAAVLEAKKENDDPLSGMQQGKGYAGGERFAVHYVFATNGHRYGEFDRFTQRQSGPFPLREIKALPGRLLAQAFQDAS
jgi:type I restriction enzyme, R subunit